MEEILKNGPMMNQEWVKRHPKHHLSKCFNGRIGDIETSCEITAHAIIEHLYL